MRNDWLSDDVANAVANYLNSKRADFQIDYIVTFDERGISSHPNHIAVHRGVR